MVIVYVSHLTGDYCSGPTYSVPNQIIAQSKNDNVLWLNLVKNVSNEVINRWKKLDIYKDLDEVPSGRIIDLPSPFNKPHLVVFEEFYDYFLSKTLIDVWTNNFKYIIVPRGELTAAAQKRKLLKKSVANLFFFNRFVNKSVGIQYLTEGEKSESDLKWRKDNFVIPNGINIPSSTKKDFSKDALKFVMIGRLEPYAKGIDILLEAVYSKESRLREEKCHFEIYGPDVDGKVKELKSYIESHKIDDIVKINGPLYGQDKIGVLLSSDIFVMTSRLEGLPMALLEALSYGLPCLVTTGTNMTEVVDEFCAGWTAKTTVESVTETLECLLNNRSRIEEYSLNARKLSCNYSWESISKQSHECYLKIVQGRNNDK